MRRHLFILVALPLIAAADDAKTDSEQLQGTWTAVAADENGKADDRLKGHRLTFDGDKFTIKTKDGQLKHQGTYRLAADKKPATIDFTHTEGELKGKTWKGIYALDGDRLKICDNAPDLAKDRPTDFKAAAGSGCVCLSFERAKR